MWHKCLHLRKEITGWEVLNDSACQDIRGSCTNVTYPSDKWAQHELFQTGQKNSIFHRYSGGRSMIDLNKVFQLCQSGKDRSQPGNYISSHEWASPAEVHRSSGPIHLIWTSWEFPLRTAVWMIFIHQTPFAHTTSTSSGSLNVGVSAQSYPAIFYHFVLQHHANTH